MTEINKDDRIAELEAEVARLQSLWEPISAAAAKELKLGTMPDLLDCPDDIGQTSSGAHRLAHLIVQWDAEKRRADRLADDNLKGLDKLTDAIVHSNVSVLDKEIYYKAIHLCRVFLTTEDEKKLNKELCETTGHMWETYTTREFQKKEVCSRCKKSINHSLPKRNPPDASKE